MILSIITINYQSAADLNSTLESTAFLRGYPDIEHIIVDGGSTDGSIELIKNYNPNIWISEKDDGIYHAMNKGIRIASGKYICMLNSGDQLLKSNFSKALENLRILDSDIVSFGIKYKGYDDETREKIPDLKSLKKYREFMPLNHQGLCILKGVYDELGFYNQHFAICADCEWLHRYISERGGNNISFEEIVLVDMQRGGISDVSSSIWLRTKEHFKIRSMYNENYVVNVLYALKYYLGKSLKSVIKKVMNV